MYIRCVFVYIGGGGIGVAHTGAAAACGHGDSCCLRGKFVGEFAYFI